MPADERTVTFSCRVRGEEMEWWINGEYSSHQRNQKLHNAGVDFQRGSRVNGVVNGSITFPVTDKFNSTRLKCIALNLTTTYESSYAILTIAGIIIYYRSVHG